VVLRVLFVCSGNVSRSRTAEDMFRGLGGLEVRSAGTHWTAQNRVSRELIDWADKIFVMEEEHKEHVVEKRPEAAGKVVVLGIPDVYNRNDPVLRRVLAEKLKAYLPEVQNFEVEESGMLDWLVNMFRERKRS